ncbi:macrophage mannose receptor 1-like [Cebidichthys violaceus]|uniref:macrophage mannose receptor 1-like n=1 Tax=Cebidichthys violaceus TaxID=271503 RepID=UPI0035CBAF7E
MVWLQNAVPFIGILLLFQRTNQLIPQQYHLINGSLTWREAQSFCRVKYTDLAAVDNMNDKNELVNTLGSQVTNSWIGLQRGKTDRWIWSDGRGPTRYTKWNVDEPNGGDVERCVEISEEGVWNDVLCGEDNGLACYELRQDGTQRYLFYSKFKNWVNSRELCREKHIDMAYISTESENSEIAKVAKALKKQLWIGLFKDAWMWSDGRETSFRFWLSGSHSRGDCASVAVSQQGRWVEAPCDEKATFVCQGGLKVKKMVIRMIVRSDVDLTDSTVSDDLLKQLDAGLRQQSVTDFKLSWRSDNSGLIFHCHEQLAVEKKTKC